MTGNSFNKQSCEKVIVNLGKLSQKSALLSKLSVKYFGLSKSSKNSFESKTSSQAIFKNLEVVYGSLHVSL